AMAKLDGRTIYSQELHDLKDQRLLAEKYTRKTFEILDRRITEFLKQPAKQGNKDDIILRAKAKEIKEDIERRLAKKFYWDTGTKLEELVDFIMWRKVADRLNIDLVDKSVVELFDEEIFSNPPLFFGQQDAQDIFHEARGN